MVGRRANVRPGRAAIHQQERLLLVLARLPGSRDTHPAAWAPRFQAAVRLVFLRPARDDRLRRNERRAWPPGWHLAESSVPSRTQGIRIPTAVRRTAGNWAWRSDRILASPENPVRAECTGWLEISRRRLAEYRPARDRRQRHTRAEKTPRPDMQRHPVEPPVVTHWRCDRRRVSPHQSKTDRDRPS